MVEKQVILHNASGLHARPAAEFVKEASKFASDIRVLQGDAEWNAKSIMALLTGGISAGDEITIRAEGADEQQAIDTLIALLASFEEQDGAQ
ncbi:MAG TPA: HPr family phosphocarrier protein [Clostridiales bacterium]|jgi:phosphotransferase system HPr (HPr) family protein|nr:HPr family phosphocarrier protein [Clostridiales bacterium]